MTTMLADRLAAARRRRFVGRETELARFAAVLDAAELPLAVLAVHGPGGVGKSTLIRRFAELAGERQVRVLALDARDVPASPDAVEAAVAPLLAGDGRRVLLLDTYELLADLDAWLREDLLPRLPADTLVVLAGRRPPGSGWRADPGWAEVLESMPLRNLTPAQARQYLEVVGVPEGRRETCVGFTHGYPLALALAGELARQADLAPQDSPDLVRELLERLLDEVPDGDHRSALEACAQVRVLTEPLLAAMLRREDVAALFAWLRGLPIVESGPFGLFPHDIARAVLDADLRWRDADRHAGLHALAREHFLDLLPRSLPDVQQRLLLDLMFLHAGLRGFLLGAAPQPPGVRLAPLASGHAEAVVAMVGDHEGGESAALAEYWLRRRPEDWRVVTDVRGGTAGAMLLLDVATCDDEDASRDPAVAAARADLACRAPLRAGEHATHLRFWLAASSYQSVGPVQNMLAAAWAVHYLTTPGVAFTFTPFADPQRWAPFCAYADQHRSPTADFTVGGHHYGVYGHDWRAVPPSAWVRLLAERESGDLGAAPAQAPAPAPTLVLSEEEFSVAVRTALRDLHRPDRLARNPLVRSRVAAGRADADTTAARGAALRDLLVEAVQTVGGPQRDGREFRALNRTFLRPAGTHEKAAELLGLPSSTFRRHLGEGVARVTALLWAQELEG